MLTVFRLLLVPPMALSLLAGDLTRAGIIFVVAAATDAVDGWIARRWHSVTTLGQLMDPVADKLLVGTAVALLWWTGLLPDWFALAVALREGFVLVASVWARGRGHADELRPDPFGKTGNAVQMALVALILLPLPLVLKTPTLLQALMIAATFLNLVSAARYAQRWIRARGSDA
ncbi:CDP-alcohol phosphatidyltransferase family protein [Sphingosinicella soli]|uniref:CDP-diacylglycerol--glycerol-3-phosphate 3-phosphatidyltransferase n=1 Tax=Sphingosinicella soli TaxID=333708 RepID=A0A7W7B1F3_9SPHN|nr:CDP-alcohol phosphatidyltransferase family protein [Sphingosinicella soli]MBB4632129.1 cardiolipin synthase [Sphingosinicella soli]